MNTPIPSPPSARSRAIFASVLLAWCLVLAGLCAFDAWRGPVPAPVATRSF